MKQDLVHGGAIDVMRMDYPDAPKPWIDLSTGINPWPYPNIKLSRKALTHLPTSADYQACQQAMATAIDAPPQTLILAPGSELLIRLLPDMLSAERVAILSPTYGDHSEAWRRAGVEIMHSENPLGLASMADIVVVTQPNNPNGRVFTLQALESARQELARRGGWLIIDEAYVDLRPEQSLARHEAGADGLILLRSFGKFFGLAGLRLGAMLAPESLADAMAKRLGVWPISGAALEIGTRAYSDVDWQIQTRTLLANAAARLDALLSEANIRVIGGTELFRFIEHPNANDVFEHLARQGIYVRRFAWSKQHLRIGLPANSEAEWRLRAALSLLD
ncbi:MAG: threonine-phosphate decarboxylase [Henriciella sp.]|nr:threonine-phosphate decarboxylase [Henriciella sp.]